MSASAEEAGDAGPARPRGGGHDRSADEL